MSDTIQEKLESAFREIRVEVPEKDRLTITVGKEAVMSVLSYLKSNGYDHLALISCVDWIEDKEFEIVYVLSAYLHRDEKYTEIERMNIIVQTRIPRDRPEFISVIPVFGNAEPYEREIHELFGVKFAGHPRLTPLFLEREYEIPPFRKDFDTRQYVKDVFDKIPPVKHE